MGDGQGSSSRKHFKGRMAAKGVFSLVLAFAYVALATSQSYDYTTKYPPTKYPTTKYPPTKYPPTHPTHPPTKYPQTYPTQPPTHPTHQRSTHQRSTHPQHRIMEDIKSHFASASTPGQQLLMHTGETQRPCAGPRVHQSAMLTATLTVATSNQLPVHQGASLPWPATSRRVQSGSDFFVHLLHKQFVILKLPW